MRHFCLLAWIIIAFSGCGGSDTTSSGFGSSGCLELAGNAATVTVTGAPLEVLESAGLAQNTVDDDGSPVPGNLQPYLAVGSCGTVGLVYLDDVAGNSELRYLDVSVDQGVPETVDDGVSWADASAALAFDADCVPHLVTSTDDQDLVDYTRGADGVWTAKVLDAAGALGGQGGRVYTDFAALGTDGVLRILGWVWVDGGKTPLVITYSDGAWTVAGYPVLSEAEQVFAWAAAEDGSVHAVFNIPNTYPCDPCNRDLMWGRTTASGPWESAQVEGTVWGNPDDRFADQADLAIDKEGQPVIAARWRRSAITGSLKNSELVLYAPRSDLTWCGETAVSAPDGYGGGDGPKFTGEMPTISLDNQGNPHIAFQDLTEWHNGQGWANGIQGQARHAVRTGGGWTTTTVLSQPGQIDSPNPLQGFVRAVAVPTADGKSVWLAGSQRVWETDSIYNDTAVPVTWKLQVFRLDIAY
jgi:hypothetical protein